MRSWDLVAMQQKLSSVGYRVMSERWGCWAAEALDDACASRTDYGVSRVQCQGCMELRGLRMWADGSEGVECNRCTNDSWPGLQPVYWHHGREP